MNQKTMKEVRKELIARKGQSGRAARKQTEEY